MIPKDVRGHTCLCLLDDRLGLHQLSLQIGNPPVFRIGKR